MAINRLKSTVRSLKKRKKHLEAKVRKRLPLSMGGRFQAEDVETRTLTEDDLEAYCKMYGIQLTSERRQNLQKIFHQEERFQTGVFWQGELVASGTCSPMWHALGIEGQWFGGDLVVSHLRGRGLGQILHMARLQEARRRGIHEVLVNVASDNIANLRALQAKGFSPLPRSQRNTTIENHLKTGKQQIILSQTLL